MEEIRDYLLPRNLQGAENVRRSIEATIDFLAAFPALGRNTDIVNVRVMSVFRYPYLVYHAVQGDELVVLHIRHTARDAPESGEIQL